MKYERFLFALTCTILLLSACSKGTLKEQDLTKRPAQHIPSSSFSGQPIAALLPLKYNRAQLKCKLQMIGTHQKSESDEHSKEIIFENAVDTISWDLLNDSAIEGTTIELTGTTYQSSSWIKATIKIKQFKVFDSVNYTDPAGRIFAMQYSPVIALSYSYEYKIISATNYEVFSSKGNGTGDLFEGIPSSLLSDSVSTEVTADPSTYSEKLDCTVDTELKSEFKDQWKRTN